MCSTLWLFPVYRIEHSAHDARDARDMQNARDMQIVADTHGLWKPLLGARCLSGVWPPSKPSFGLRPASTHH